VTPRRPAPRTSARTDLDAVWQRAQARFVLDYRHSIHGVAHWRRVQENGLRIAAHSGADPLLVRLFACLHDCCREYDGGDPEHGPRAAAFAAMLRGDLLLLDDADFELLSEALRNHTRGYTHTDPLVATCWDADRLDLPRCVPFVDTRRLSTDFARRPDVIRWAHERARTGRTRRRRSSKRRR